MKVPLTDRAGAVVAHATVDDVDAPLVGGMRWHLDKGYAVHSDYVDGRFRRTRMHRLILELAPGDPHVDHRDLDRLNNRRSNLRTASRSQNKQNSRKYRTYGGEPTASRHRGVTFRADRGLWRATARLDGRIHYIGSSRDEDEAGRLAAEWRRANMPYSEMDQTSKEN